MKRRKKRRKERVTEKCWHRVEQKIKREVEEDGRTVLLACHKSILIKRYKNRPTLEPVKRRKRREESRLGVA